MIGEIKPYNSFGDADLHAMHDFAIEVLQGRLLSGYLAGRERGGDMVRTLEDKWCETFGVKYAIACNSATSGLLAAAFVVGLRRGDTFVCPAMTMSATAAAPMFTGAIPEFRDVEDETFGLDPAPIAGDIRAVFSANLFGHPARLGHALMRHSTAPLYHIEDNSQSPFAMFENGRFAGTHSHIGVWSLNVHKHIQCGEGGMVTTDDGKMAVRLRAFINHGENSGGPIGLNLRMPELCAAVALTQLNRGKEIVQDRVDQAEAILAAIGDIPGIRLPVVREGCTHVYYTIPFLLDDKTFAGPRRSMFCAALRGQGVPIVEGYVEPLYRLPAFKRFARPCPMAEDLQDRRLFYFENCAWSPTSDQIKLIGDAFRKAAKEVFYA